MDTRSIGNNYEELAVKYLEEEGHIIVDRNFRNRNAEIDIISKEKVCDSFLGETEYFVFTEVKYRSSTIHGEPFEAVDYIKQKKICKAALKYIAKYGTGIDTPVRFDVISIESGTVNHIKNAFSYIS